MFLKICFCVFFSSLLEKVFLNQMQSNTGYIKILKLKRLFSFCPFQIFFKHAVKTIDVNAQNYLILLNSFLSVFPI